MRMYLYVKCTFNQRLHIGRIDRLDLGHVNLKYQSRCSRISIIPYKIPYKHQHPYNSRRYNRPSTVTTASMPSHHDISTLPRPRLLRYINDSTKWTVSFAAFMTLTYRRDILSAWCIFGSIVAAIICRLLKFAINESRPPCARKKDPGMPSAHANSLAFLSTFVSTSTLFDATSIDPGTFILRYALIIGVPCIGIFLAWLRVALGYHTALQVCVGWFLGSSLAASWSYYGMNSALPVVQSSAPLQAALWCLTGIAAAFFSYKNIKRWFDETHSDNQKNL